MARSSNDQKVIEQFRPLVHKALNQYVGDQVNDRLKAALGDDADGGTPTPRVAAPTPVAEVPADSTPATALPDSEVVTTAEELEGFNIVRAIACAHVAPERIHHRDGKAYFAVLLDDNNRKPIIRLHLNSRSKKFVTAIEDGKDGTRHDIESVVDVYRVASDAIRQTLKAYDGGSQQD